MRTINLWFWNVLTLSKVNKTIFLKMNLDSKCLKWIGWVQALHRLIIYLFKKKRKLFLIFQLSISKNKFNVTIKIKYLQENWIASILFFFWLRNLNLIPFQKLKDSHQIFSFHNIFMSFLGSTHSFSIDVQMKPFSFFNPKGSLFCICYYKQDL